MKRVIRSSRNITRHYAQSAENKLADMIGISRWGSSNVSLRKIDEGKWNHAITARYERLTQDSEYIESLKKIGAKYITIRYGTIYFYYDTTKLAEQQAEEQRKFDDQYDAELSEINISVWKPSKSVLDKLMEYRAKGSMVNVKAIKDPNKLLTYFYASILMGWDELRYLIDGSHLSFDYEDEMSAIAHSVSADPSLSDSRSEMDQKLNLSDSKGLFTFEEKNCWLPKSILQFFIDNDIPVHFGKRTSGAQYDHNGAQWSEIEHLTLYPEDENPIEYNIVVHTHERADGSIPNTYTGNGTQERVSAKQIIEDLKRIITLKD